MGCSSNFDNFEQCSREVKVAFDREGKVINLMPEYESCRQAAEKKKVPLKEVYQEAIEKGRETLKHKG